MTVATDEGQEMIVPTGYFAVVCGGWGRAKTADVAIRNAKAGASIRGKTKTLLYAVTGDVNKIWVSDFGEVLWDKYAGQVIKIQFEEQT